MVHISDVNGNNFRSRWRIYKNLIDKPVTYNFFCHANMDMNTICSIRDSARDTHFLCKVKDKRPEAYTLYLTFDMDMEAWHFMQRYFQFTTISSMARNIFGYILSLSSRRKYKYYDEILSNNIWVSIIFWLLPRVLALKGKQISAYRLIKKVSKAFSSLISCATNLSNSLSPT